MTAVAVGCTDADDSDPISSSTADADVQALRQREVLATGDCADQPTVEKASKDIGPLVGDGPVRVVANADGTVPTASPETYGSETWGGNKLLIAVSDEIDGPVLVRGLSQHGGDLGFGTDPAPEDSQVLSIDGRQPLGGGWYDFPNAVRVEQGGCYTLQFDYPQGTSRVELAIDDID
ncbi:MAG: hypothetical protein AAGF73_07820 [Actinomycetota bacterium]